MTDKAPLHIVKLVSENVKKLTAVSITPTGKVVQITGKNGSGKTSTLNSIWWALAGAGAVQAAPIRKGEQTATIKLDLGELLVTRKFSRRDDGEFTTSIKVESADGGQYSKPQQILDGIVGELAFDPLEFARAKPNDQLEKLKGLVGIDFEKADGLNRADFEKRTTINREAKEKMAQAHGIAIPEATPTERVDETAIVEEISQVGAFNAELERRAERREQVRKDAEFKRDAAEGHRAKAAELRHQAEAEDQAARQADEDAAALEEKLRTAEPLPAAKDAAEVRARLEEAKRTNAAVEQMLRRKMLLAEAADLEKQSEELTARMAAREEEKHKQIAAAKMPVDGLGFADDFITFNGVPFDQASDAEQLRVSIAIAMAANPRLKVILVRDGSLLDEDSMKLLADMAEANNCQVWVESVDSSGRVGIVMEDGHVVSTPETRTAQAAE